MNELSRLVYLVVSSIMKIVTSMIIIHIIYLSGYEGKISYVIVILMFVWVFFPTIDYIKIAQKRLKEESQ